MEDYWVEDFKYFTQDLVFTLDNSLACFDILRIIFGLKISIFI